MKKSILLLFVLFSFSLNAQELWFDAGVKGAWGPTLLMNKNAMSESYLNQQVSNGFGYGAKFAVNFGYIHGFTFDFMMNTAHQEYKVTDDKYTPVDVKWKTYDLYVLYRLYRTINYMEIGPKFSKVASFRNNDVDSKQFYLDAYPSAVLGFGWYVFGNKAFTGTLGVRIEYALNDILSQEGKDNGYPVYPFKTEPYETYTPTNPLVAQLSFELNWGLGYFAKTACGERKHFFSF